MLSLGSAVKRLDPSPKGIVSTLSTLVSQRWVCTPKNMHTCNSDCKLAGFESNGRPERAQCNYLGTRAWPPIV